MKTFIKKYLVSTLLFISMSNMTASAAIISFDRTYIDAVSNKLKQQIFKENAIYKAAVNSIIDSGGVTQVDDAAWKLAIAPYINLTTQAEIDSYFIGYDGAIITIGYDAYASYPSYTFSKLQNVSS